jgi:polysaccharide chain length determinant protein (PEP-CTERM system associated)
VEEEAVAERQISFQDVLAIARRRFWWILVPALVGPVAGFLASLLIKPVFTSKAFVIVEQQKVPDAFVPTMVMDQLETRLLTMKDEILSRSRLEPIILELGLFGRDRNSASIDDLVARLRKQINLTTIRPDSTNALRGFYMTVDQDNPQTAQQVCKRVLSMFMDENLKARSERAANTTQFLADQLADAKQRLDENDAKLAAFKTKYLGRLPTDEQSNLQMLSTLSSRLDSVNDAITQAQQQRATQMMMLAQQTRAGRTGNTGATAASELEKLAELRAQFASLQARYTPEHPEIAKVKEEIETLQKRIQATHEAAPTVGSDVEIRPELETAETAQLRVSVQAIDETLRTKRADRARLDQEIASFQARIQLSPVIEEQYKVLTRDYEGALQFYSDLLTKKTQSEVVRDLEQRREGEQFHVMDAPSLPSKPSSPNRVKFALGGLFSGFVFGAALAVILDLTHRLIRTERDVAVYLEIPLLAAIADLERTPKALAGKHASG